MTNSQKSLARLIWELSLKAARPGRERGLRDDEKDQKPIIWFSQGIRGYFCGPEWPAGKISSQGGK